MNIMQIKTTKTNTDELYILHCVHIPSSLHHANFGQFKVARNIRINNKNPLTLKFNYNYFNLLGISDQEESICTFCPSNLTIYSELTWQHLMFFFLQLYHKKVGMIPFIHLSRKV